MVKIPFILCVFSTIKRDKSLEQNKATTNTFQNLNNSNKSPVNYTE